MMPMAETGAICLPEGLKRLAGELIEEREDVSVD